MLVSITCRTSSKSWSRKARPSPWPALASSASTAPAADRGAELVDAVLGREIGFDRLDGGALRAADVGGALDGRLRRPPAADRSRSRAAMMASSRPIPDDAPVTMANFSVHECPPLPTIFRLPTQCGFITTLMQSSCLSRNGDTSRAPRPG